MDSIPYSHLERGTLLIASPDIESGFYSRSVLLLCDHSPSGSFALTINKPIEVELPEDLLKANGNSHPQITMCMGGPLQPNQLMLLHSFSDAPDQTLKICDGIYLGGDLNFLQDLLDKEPRVPLRLCFGYSGWSTGQLEREFMTGGWYLHPASVDLVFNTPPEQMWQACLRAMGGKYATLSMLPEDLSVN
jgi:putative transcriptional regulator